jgi:6-phosphogluconolactonase
MNPPDHNVQVRVFSSKEILAKEAAELYSSVAQSAVKKQGRFSIVLPGGSTPQTLFSLLAIPPYAVELPWSSTHVFWGDERLVSPDDPGSNYYHAAQRLLSMVPIPPANIHRVKGELPAQNAVEDMMLQLKDYAAGERLWPRFDLVLLGLGSDGHTASLFPGTPGEEDPGVSVKSVTAVYENRPAKRLTLTPLVFNDAHRILFMVSGANKADALAAVLNGPQDLEKWPAQRIQPTNGTVSWFVDQAAASNFNANGALSVLG